MRLQSTVFFRRPVEQWRWSEGVRKQATAGARHYGHRLLSRSRAVLASTLVVVWLAAAAMLPDAPPAVAPHADHPPLAHTGGFGESTCHVCHFDNGLNEPGGRLWIEGLPDAYGGGQVLELTVRIEHAELKRSGFMLSSRSGSGSQAGRFESASTHVRITSADSTGVAYLHHTPAGTGAAVAGAASWVFRWIAPTGRSSADTVFFHVAANASNFDESAFGDFIYTTELRLPPK